MGFPEDGAEAWEATRLPAGLGAPGPEHRWPAWALARVPERGSVELQPLSQLPTPSGAASG